MANNIRQLRIDMALKQEDLVRLVNQPGFDVPLLSKIENDRCRPTPEQEEAICKALQAHPVELYGQWRTLDIPLGNARKTQYELKKENAPFTVQELVTVLGEGKANAKTAQELMRAMDVTNRELRLIIAKAYKYGYFVGNDQDGEGYYIISTVDEGQRIFRQERARALAVLREKMGPLAQWVIENGGTL